MRELGMRLYCITWPLWSPLHLAAAGDWHLVPMQIALMPLLFPFGLVLHTGIIAFKITTGGYLMGRRILRALLEAADVTAWCLFMVVMLVAAASMNGCAAKRSRDPIPPVEPSVADRALYRETEARIVERHLQNGFGVVSLKPTGDAEHQGEALIWGGTFLYGASCEGGSAVSAAMRDMIRRGGGQIVRVEPLGEYADGKRAVTLDGMIGLMAGVARRVVSCGEAEDWQPAWSTLVAWQKSNGGKLNDGATARLEAGFEYVRDLIQSRLQGTAAPGGRDDFQKAAANWPALVLASHLTGIGSDACFRVNLSWTSIVTTELLGDELGQVHRDRLCSDTASMGIPTVDHYCGRDDLEAWVAGYVPDVWEYRHQRCASPWESPDGGSNVSPRLDLLIALVARHGWDALQGEP
jgi:hypothetical protein